MTHRMADHNVSTCFGDENDSHLELVDEMLTEFNAAGGAVSGEDLRRVWKSLASSERLILDLLPSREGLTQQLNAVTDRVNRAEEEHHRAKTHERETIVALNTAKRNFMVSLQQDLPELSNDDPARTEHILQHLEDYRRSLEEAKRGIDEMLAVINSI